MLLNEYVERYHANYGAEFACRIYFEAGSYWVLLSRQDGENEHTLEAPIPKAMFNKGSFDNTVTLLHKKLMQE